MAREFRDYYQLLGVGRHASPDEIKAAYRRLAQALHPDANPDPDAHQRFVQVSEAYRELSDTVRRQVYNMRYDLRQHAYTPPVIQQPVYETEPATPRMSRREEFARYRWIVFTIGFIGLLFGLSVVLDYAAAWETVTKTVRSIKKDDPRPGQMLVEAGNKRFQAAEDQVPELRPGDRITLHITPLYHTVTLITVCLPGSPTDVCLPRSAPVHPNYGIYNIFLPFLAALFLSALMSMALFRRHPEQSYQLALLTILFFVINIGLVYAS
ncbi:MAG: hypothetical protein EAZ89_12350 [Bacteroidetes bacterium]|nr:MAG: hypothetical protein EAZ89_12350 [Bacteroidota bacterium]